MSKKFINQNDILNLEFLNIINYSYIFNNSPIKRLKKKIDKKDALKNLEKKINSIEDCVSGNNNKKIVFGDGNINSEVMIIEDVPGELEENSKKPFMGETTPFLQGHFCTRGHKLPEAPLDSCYKESTPESDRN